VTAPSSKRTPRRVRAAELALAWGALALVWQVGLLATRLLRLPLPGPLTGMALLLALLVLWPGSAAKLEPAARPLLAAMILFFVPAGAKVVALAPRLAGSWLPIAAVVVLSTLLALVVTAWVVRGLVRWEVKRGRA